MDRKDYIAGILKGLRYRAIPGSVSCQAADLIEQQAAEIERLLKSDGWVSVKERLPDKADIYWCAINHGPDQEPGAWYFAFRPTDKKWYASNDPDNLAKNIYAWFELPTPPGGDHD